MKLFCVSIVLGEYVLFVVHRSINGTLQFSVERNHNKSKDATNDEKAPEEPTWVHEIFQGILTSETRCLNCETVSFEQMLLVFLIIIKI